jgi:hypothetical protein
VWIVVSWHHWILSESYTIDVLYLGFSKTHMPSYHCSDNVNIEWNKGNQAFKLYMQVNW